MKTIDNQGIRSIPSLVMATALSIGLGFASHASAQQRSSYLIDLNSRTATELGDLSSYGIVERANAINDAGQVVGWSGMNDGGAAPPHAFITGPNGVGMTDLGALGASYSQAYGINATGQVVGQSISGGFRAFITGPNGVGMKDMGTLGDYSIANSINAAGQVVGDYGIKEYSSDHSFITGPNGVGMTDLGALPGGNWTHASGINATGQVTGASTTTDAIHAFITGPNGVGMTDLGALPGRNYSYANGINAAGQVVGWSNTTQNGWSAHAFITGPNGVGMTELGSPGGGISQAYGINDAGQAIGYFVSATGARTAFITGPDGVGMTDLNSLMHLPNGRWMNEAVAINNMGQVIVIAGIPEPESYALMLAGLVLTGVMVRRKQKADAREVVLGL